MTIRRSANRAENAPRALDLQLDFVPYPAGSVLASMGNTRILCNATVEAGVPRWRMGEGAGWLTAEYSMLPASTHTRSRRERHGPKGRSQEIQRLIGRSLRAALDLSLLGERTITIDCDVLQADGGTRTTAINGGFVALALACGRLMRQGILSENPFKRVVTALSCGVVQGSPVVDLDYIEDSQAEVDLNLILDHHGDLIEIQGTGEGGVLPRETLNTLLDLSLGAAETLRARQLEALEAFAELNLGEL